MVGLMYIGITERGDACLCLAEKKELLTNKSQCLHGCIYCYWQGVQAD